MESTNIHVRADQLRLQVVEQEPPLGSHVVTPRRGYLHHGIYVGGGKVVHYAGLARGLQRGPVEEVSLACFTRGRPVWVKADEAASFDSQEVIRRARSRVGEDRYRLLSNNCEHFCEWCLRGERRSYQVEAVLARPGRALEAVFGGVIARWRSPAQGLEAPRECADSQRTYRRMAQSNESLTQPLPKGHNFLKRLGLAFHRGRGIVGVGRAMAERLDPPTRGRLIPRKLL
jgi:hypothetical protein